MIRGVRVIVALARSAGARSRQQAPGDNRPRAILAALSIVRSARSTVNVMNPHPPQDRSTPASHGILDIDPRRGATTEAQQDAALQNPGTLAKTEDVSSTPVLGAAGEVTQGARTSDIGNPSKA